MTSVKLTHSRHFPET